jgi:hypothetical protein
MAFHDVATHDKETGVGGLDASIQFESSRAENNPGVDFINGTLGFFNNYYSIRSSASDMTALGVVLAVGNCGGPKIPLRVGRVDAKEAGAMGVPEPQQDLDTHKKRFATAGFSTEDMIAMVACGHTMGGVHGKTFPEITENANQTNVVHFDSTEADFDANVATEYLDGTTKNPLVVAHNDTLNSDKRIFAADNNVTMKALADPKNFQSMCSDIFERMINTVPAEVELTEPLEPIVVKPDITAFSLINATHIKLEGRIRLLTDNDRYNDETVVLTYEPRNAPPNNSTSPINTTITTTPADYKLGLSSGIFNELFKWHEFALVLPTSSSIKSFNVTVTRTSTGEKTRYNNAGYSFPLDDTVLYQPAQSCHTDHKFTLTAAVRTDAADNVIARVAKKVNRVGSFVPGFEMEDWKAEKGVKVGDWVLVTAKGELDPATRFSTHFDILAGDKGVEFLGTNAVGENCVEL